MQAAGLVSAPSFVAPCAPMMAVSKWIDARRTAPFDRGEFHVRRRSTGATGVVAIERGLIRHGVSWPAEACPVGTQAACGASMSHASMTEPS